MASSYLPSPPPSAAKNRHVAALARKEQLPTPKNAAVNTSVFVLSPPEEDDVGGRPAKSPKPLPELAVSHSLTHKRHMDNHLSPYMPSPRKAVPPPPPSKNGTPMNHLNRSRSAFLSPVPQKIVTGQASKASLSPLYNPSVQGTYLDQCFEMQGRIGAGCFSEVYRVRGKEDGLLYAVKRTKQPFRGVIDRDSKLREVAAVRSLHGHPNCVACVDAWEESGYLYIQMELCERSLKDYSESLHVLDEDELWDFLADIASGLKHIHTHNLVHCDIKPANIFLTEDHTLKIGDFGISKSTDSNADSDEENEGDGMYLAPEVLKGHIGAAADIFSLGLTMFEIAVNVDLPANGPMWQSLRSSKDFPRELIECVSSELADLIVWMTDPDPNNRPTVDDILAHHIVSAHAARRRKAIVVRNIRDGTFRLFIALWHRLCLCVAVVVHCIAHMVARDGNSVGYAEDREDSRSHREDYHVGRRVELPRTVFQGTGNPSSTRRYYESEHEDASGNESDPASPITLRRQSMASSLHATQMRPVLRGSGSDAGVIRPVSPAVGIHVYS
eukprot:Opistho-2@64362